VGEIERRVVNFDRIAADYDVTRGGAQRASAAARDLAAHLPPGDSLEIGVGTGIVAHAVLREAPQVRRVVGIDVSAKMLALARPRLPGTVLRAAAELLPFPDGRFDAVIAVHVLHVVPDLDAAFVEAARVLRPGGRVVALHGRPEHHDDELTRATRGLRALMMAARPDSPEAVLASACVAGLRCRDQHPSSPRRSHHSPAELAELITSRSWSYLWALDETVWESQVEPAIEALRALPDQRRPRPQESRLWVSVLERP